MVKTWRSSMTAVAVAGWTRRQWRWGQSQRDGGSGKAASPGRYACAGDRQRHRPPPLYLPWRLAGGAPPTRRDGRADGWRCRSLRLTLPGLSPWSLLPPPLPRLLDCPSGKPIWGARYEHLPLREGALCQSQGGWGDARQAAPEAGGRVSSKGGGCRARRRRAGGGRGRRSWSVGGRKRGRVATAAAVEALGR